MSDAVRTPPIGRRPVAVTLAAIVLVVLAAVQVLVASLFVTNQDELTQSMMAAAPTATAEQLDDRIFAAVASGIVVHAILTIVYLAAAIALRTRAKVVRLFVTGLAVVATFTDALILVQLPAWLPRETSLIYGVLAGSTTLRALVIILLWLPASARGWYRRDVGSVAA